MGTLMFVRAWVWVFCLVVGLGLGILLAPKSGEDLARQEARAVGLERELRKLKSPSPEPSPAPPAGAGSPLPPSTRALAMRYAEWAAKWEREGDEKARQFYDRGQNERANEFVQRRWKEYEGEVHREFPGLREALLADPGEMAALLGEDAAVPHLRRLLGVLVPWAEGSFGKVRFSALPPPLQEAVSRLLKAPTPARRHSALEFLLACGDVPPALQDACLALMRDPDASVQRSAINLADQRGWVAPGQLLSTLEALVQEAKTPEARANLLYAIRGKGTDEARAVLQRWLDSGPDPDIQCRLIGNLETWGSDRPVNPSPEMTPRLADALAQGVRDPQIFGWALGRVLQGSLDEAETHLRRATGRAPNARQEEALRQILEKLAAGERDRNVLYRLNYEAMQE